MREVRIVLCVALLALAAGSALGSGKNIEWDVCGIDGVINKDFTCDSNTGSGTFLVSFVPEAGQLAVAYVECTVGVETPDASALPNWWLLGDGGCRTSALAVSAEGGPDSAGCRPLLGASVPFWNYSQVDPSAAYLVVDVGLGTPTVLDAAVEYFAFRCRVNYSNTVGPGSCAGCGSPMKLWILSVKFSGLSGGWTELHSTYDRQPVIRWQGGGVPTHRATWGQIKGLYR